MNSSSFLQVSYLDRGNNRRMTVVGCECGTVLMALVDCRTSPPTVLNTWRDSIGEGIACATRFFAAAGRRKGGARVPPVLRGVLSDDAYFSEEAEEEDVMNLVVAFSFSPARIFRDVARNGFSKPLSLEFSNGFDAVNCAVAADVDLDGRSEVLLGTFGQELLVYKEVAEDNWRLIWTRAFSHPILALKSLDLTGDGVNELAVMTTKGIHVLQHNASSLARVREERLRAALARAKEQQSSTS
jgi:hypothetical protein